MKTIEELAREAGARELIDMGRPSAKRDIAFNAKQLARFAAAVLEEAAKVCEKAIRISDGRAAQFESGIRGCCAIDIRALKDAKP